MLTELTKISLKTKTDKSFWHKYTEVYDLLFKKIRTKVECPRILEYGVFKGESIQTYLDFFSQVEIHGVDILPERPEWPKAANVKYYKVDQGERTQVKKFLTDLNLYFDLVIEDGGHRPDQQFNSLIETIPYVKPGGAYILEDLHTSMKGHPLNKHFRLFGERFPGNCYQLLLGIKHFHELKDLGNITSDQAENILVAKFQDSCLMTKEEIITIYRRIKSIDLYKRADLPLACWQCHSDNFDFIHLKCADCGKELLGLQESMTAILYL